MITTTFDTRHARTVALVATLTLAACASSGSDKDSECSSCHGSSENSAPPVSTSGASLTSDVAVGAHQQHVREGTLRDALTCAECHITPAAVDAPGHNDGARAGVIFGVLSRSDGAEPAWTIEQATCSGVYCHGSFSGGSYEVVTWTRVDGSQSVCGQSCHEQPPATGSHVRHAESGYDCDSCHAGATSGQVARHTHINGVKDTIATYDPITRSCATECHEARSW